MASGNLTKGIKRYVALGNKEVAERNRQIKKIASEWKFDTIAVHGLYTTKEALEKNQGAIIEPIYMSSSQAYRDSDELEAALAYLIPTWCYSRIANPSTYYYEWTLALLEAYKTGVSASCCSTSSGMSAIYSAVEPFLVKQSKAKDERINFVAACQVYGGTFQQFAVRKHQERGIEWRKVVNSADLSEWKSLIDDDTRFLYGELPSNPGQAFFDIEAVAKLAHKHNIPLIVDTTVATPALLRPLQWGADIVVHSATKSLTTSGFGVCGAVIAKHNIETRIKNPALKKDFANYIKFLPNRDNGQNLSPMQAILTLNDIRTLRSKMDLMSRNTEKIAEFLETNSMIEKVDYLGCKKHPLHKLASKYMWLVDSEYDEIYKKRVNRYGHLMSFRVKGGAKATRKMFDSLERIFRATDLGRIKSVATIPAISTHQQQGEEGRKIADVPQNMVRLCVGAEHPDDIVADLDRALKKAKKLS
ncbi:MAG: aminotransferase class I/II-fold pyridoxal phosphate-dependent enzyme [Myxococcota bacterium]